jgi:hypothetical protein
MNERLIWSLSAACAGVSNLSGVLCVLLVITVLLFQIKNNNSS